MKQIILILELHMHFIVLNVFNHLFLIEKFMKKKYFSGLIGFIFTLISLFNGTVTFLAPKLRDKIRPTVMKFIHTLCGCSAITMGLVTLCIGLDKGIFGNTDSVAFAIAMIVLSLAFTILNPALSIRGYLANMRTTEL